MPLVTYCFILCYKKYSWSKLHIMNFKEHHNVQKKKKKKIILLYGSFTASNSIFNVTTHRLNTQEGTSRGYDTTFINSCTLSLSLSIPSRALAFSTSPHPELSANWHSHCLLKDTRKISLARQNHSSDESWSTEKLLVADYPQYLFYNPEVWHMHSHSSG